MSEFTVNQATAAAAAAPDADDGSFSVPSTSGGNDQPSSEVEGEVTSSSDEGSGSNPPLPSNNHHIIPRIRKWTQYELDTVCALLCKYGRFAVADEHKKVRKRTSASKDARRADTKFDYGNGFAAKLNEALRIGGSNKPEVPMIDVRHLMAYMEAERSDTLAFIARQPAPFRISQTKSRVFRRACTNLNRNLREFIIGCYRAGRSFGR